MKAVIIEVVCDDEFTNGVFRLGIVENSVESQTDLLIDPLEEIFLWRFGNQLENVAQRVFFRSDTVVGWNYDVYDKILNYLIFVDRQIENG